MAKNKYKVEISYLKFMFDDREVALDFAETAFMAVMGNETIKLEIIKEDDNE